MSAEYPDRTALIDGETGETRTYAEFHARASQVASMLRGLGVSRGDTFGLLMHNCVQYLEVLYGAAQVGATVVLVNRRLTPSEMQYELTDSQAAGLIYSAKFDESAHELSSLLGASFWHVRLGQAGDTGEAVSGSPDYERTLAEQSGDPRQVDHADLASAGWVIIYTSGTTGKPKGVVLTQENVAAGNTMTRRFIWSRYPGLGGHIRSLVTAGMNHIGGLTTTATPAIADGATLVILDDFEPKKMLRAIEEHRISLAFSIGMMWNAAVEEDLESYDFSSLELIGTCIVRHTDEQLKSLHERMGAEVYYMFGQTETTTGLVTTRVTSDLTNRRGVLGRPHGYMDIRIAAVDGSDVPVGEVGELLYRGPTVFKEYYGRAEDTQQAFKDGWFHSGDLVRADEDGYLYFVDRLKDMVKTGGLNVFTVEVEQTIIEHPSVTAVAVAGIPDVKWGEAVVAFVVWGGAGEPDATQIEAHCRERLAGYKVPKRIEFVDAIPTNSLGKMQKRVLVDALAADTGS
jgi:fatty-acyl-CoA synthase